VDSLSSCERAATAAFLLNREEDHNSNLWSSAPVVQPCNGPSVQEVAVTPVSTLWVLVVAVRPCTLLLWEGQVPMGKLFPPQVVEVEEEALLHLVVVQPAVTLAHREAIPLATSKLVVALVVE
jgi:hypothetical protein